MTRKRDLRHISFRVPVDEYRAFCAALPIKGERTRVLNQFIRSFINRDIVFTQSIVQSVKPTTQDSIPQPQDKA